MKNKYVALFIIVFATLSVLKKINTNENNNDVENNTNKKEKMGVEKQLTNIDLSIIKEIINDAVLDNKMFYLLYFSGYDCRTCLDISFKLLDEITFNDIYVVARGTNANYVQDDYNYDDYVYIDYNDSIAKKLRYLKTPVIMKIDNYIVKKIIQIENNDGMMVQFNDFIGDNILKIRNNKK